MSFIGVVCFVGSVIILTVLFACLLLSLFASFMPYAFITETLSHPIYTALAYVAYYLTLFLVFSTAAWMFINFVEFMAAVEYTKL